MAERPRSRPRLDLPRPRFMDFVAGVSVALVLIPQSVAYAELAGLPGFHGLFAAAIPLVVAALFASSPYLQTGPVALTSLLTLGVLVQFAPPGSGRYVGLAALLAVIVGLARIVIGVARAGWLSYLMSRPVLMGFTNAAAILIILTQLPGAFGLDPPDAVLFPAAIWAVTHPGDWEPTSLFLTVATLVVIVGARRVHPLVPGVLVATVGAIAFSSVTGYAGPTIGDLAAGVPSLQLDLPWSRAPALVLPGVVIALVGFAEAAAISRTYATLDRSDWSPDREFVAQGSANLLAGMFGGFPVGGSFSRSALNRLSGARTRWSGAISGLTVLLFLPFAGVLAPLPRAVLSAIVISAVAGLIRPVPLVGLWQLSKAQALVGWATFAFSLALAPHLDHAILLGVLLAVAAHIWREMGAGFDSKVEGDVLQLHAGGVLWFGSAPAMERELRHQLAGLKGVRRVVINLRGLGRIDLTGAMVLRDLMHTARAAGIEARFEEVPRHAHRILGTVVGWSPNGSDEAASDGP